MLGAIIGDIAGSFREFTGAEKYKNLPLLPSINEIPVNHHGKKYKYGMTDDSLLSIATAHAVLYPELTKSPWEDDFKNIYHKMGIKYNEPIGGFGRGFREWLKKDIAIVEAYNSCGNGSAMRVSPIGWAYDTIEETLKVAMESAMPTHNHPEGIKGAQATAVMIFLGRQGHRIKSILGTLNAMYLGYEPIDELGYFDAVCPDTMRLVVHVLSTTDGFEEAVFKAVTIPHGDADTLGAIVGSIAEAVYGIPPDIEHDALKMINVPELKEIVDMFREKYCKRT